MRTLIRRVVRPEVWLLTRENVTVPELDPPIYPALEPPLQPVHDTLVAPLARVALSPSTCVSDGAADHVSAEALGIQLTRFVKRTVVPEISRGSQMYVLRIRLDGTQRSPR